MVSKRTPVSGPDRTDRGADTQGRYRYQASVAALAAISMLDEESEVEEVYCEQVEDILIRCKNATFIGRQIKTRDLGLPPLKARDEEVMSAIARFVTHETRYPGSFSGYTIEANVGFARTKNGQDLLHLLELARLHDVGGNALPPILSKYLRAVAKHGKCKEGDVHSVLRKTLAKDGVPGLSVIDKVVCDRLAASAGLETKPYSDVKRAADALIACAMKAATLPDAGSVADYFDALPRGREALEAAKVNAKRLTREIVRRIIAECMSADATLKSHARIPLSELPQGMTILEEKMAAGGLSPQEIALAKDHKASAMHLVVSWMNKESPDVAAGRFDHLRVVVNTECQEAFRAAQGTAGLVGPTMLNEVTSRLRARLEKDRDRLFDCDREHLHGIAGILTEDCRLWWSEPFDLKGGSA